MIFNIVSLYDKLAIRRNYVYIGNVEYDDKYFLHKGCYYYLKYNDKLDKDSVAMNSIIRGNMGVGQHGTLDIICTSRDEIHVSKYVLFKVYEYSCVDNITITDTSSLYTLYVTYNTRAILIYNNMIFKLQVEQCDDGIITNTTKIEFIETEHINGVEISPNIIKSFNVEDVGGLHEEINTIFRRAFASRLLSPIAVKRLGIQHVKGMLLYGPPGTGKTLIARSISRMLNCDEPKKISGPEILSKYVGASEENIRSLFIDAETNPDKFYVIIIDEIDAITKKRGMHSGDTGVGDNVVNQLLAKMDGIDALDNILLIGMTNRLDMIDEALLRPGRFELHINIPLPDEEGRYEILNIHTKKLRENNRLLNVDLREISKLTPNYSGAECAGLVKCALSRALIREVDNLKINSQNIIITQDDFIKSIQEIKPMYGCNNIDKVDIDDNIFTLFKDVKRENISCEYTIDQLTYAASIHGYEYIRVISPQTLIRVGYTIQAWAQEICDIFDKTRNVTRSVIIIKDKHNIERGDIHYILNAYLNDMTLPCCKIICI